MVLLSGLYCSPEVSAYDNGAPHNVAEGLIPVNYVTFWILKPDGYHPCILMKIANHTGKNLTGERLRFQAIMVNLRNGQVTRGRMETRKPFGPKSRIFVTLVGNDPYELPISTSDWPSMECKVMARIGDIGDEGTQNLTVTEIERVAMREDDAMEAIEKMREYSQASPEELLSKLPTPPAKPMRAAPAGLLKGAPARPVPVAHKPPVDNHPKAAMVPPTAAAGSKAIKGFLSPVEMPGLGDDFLAFEQKYGLPANTERVTGGWTWALYKHTDPNITIYAGASTRKGKVDLIVAQVPANEVPDGDITEVARLLSGKNRTQKLSSLEHSVRYLSAGRTELVSAKAGTYQLAYFTPYAQNHVFTIILSRVPGEFETLLTQQTQHTAMLKPITSLFEP